MAGLRVLITGGTPDSINKNAVLRQRVADGFAAILGDNNVQCLPIEVAPGRILAWTPQLVLVFGSVLPDTCEYEAIRYACTQRSAKLAFWLHDDPYEFDGNVKISGIADYIFSNDRWAATHFHRARVWHLPLAASESPESPFKFVNDTEKQRDIFFCGVGFPSRHRILADLAPILKDFKTEVLGDGWDTDRLPFCRNVRLSASEIHEHYLTSRIVLNLGRDFHYANRRFHLTPSTPGPRTFEGALAGACQMMFVDSLEVTDYFRLNEEIILFNDPVDFRDQLLELLASPARREQIGMAARERCLNDHTYARRAQVILERVEAFQLVK